MKTATLTQVAASKWEAADRAFQKGQQAYIEFGRELAKIKDATQAEIGERYGISNQEVSRAIQVGKDNRVFNFIKSLPKSQTSLYLLTTLDDEDFTYVVEELGPETTQADILAVKAGFADAAEKAFSDMWDQAHRMNETFNKEAAAKQKRLKEEQEAKPEPEPAPAPLIDAGGRVFLIQCFQELLYEENPAALKAVKSMFSSLYHPDTGKLSKNTDLMSKINQALDSLI